MLTVKLDDQGLVVQAPGIIITLRHWAPAAARRVDYPDGTWAAVWYGPDGTVTAWPDGTVTTGGCWLGRFAPSLAEIVLGERPIAAGEVIRLGAEAVPA